MDLSMSENNICNKPKFSIIVPVYNVESTISRCLDSILNQTYEDYEVILINDGSTDSSLDICNQYKSIDRRIKVFTKINGGLSSARNTGITYAIGDYLCFVDSDDWIANDMLQHFEVLLKEHQPDIISTSYKITKKITDSEIDTSLVNTKIMTRTEALEYFLFEGMNSRVSDYPVWIKCYKKELFRNIKFPMGVLYEDYATNIRLIKKTKKYVKSSKICYFYYQGGSSIVRSGFKYKDSDLIHQSMLVEKLVSGESLLCQKFAKEKTARSYFSLLLKIAVYGFDESVSASVQKELVKKFSKQVRTHLKLLLRSSMPLNRKLLMLLMCIDYRLLLPLRIGVKK
uniref:Glycosyl transferase family 2 n=1 Tax=Streptococcus suis TaxID=1307 RepID=A0A1P8VRI8_STRSU|nr:Glycosyl transferase family 2 [Streptococcus suis]